MTAKFYDREDETNPLNGSIWESAEMLHHLFAASSGRAPFMCELSGENGSQLMIGVGPEFGCAQFSSADGSPPYWVAMGSIPEGEERELEFLVGGTATPICARYLLPIHQVEAIASEFLQTGNRTSTVEWEEI